MVISNLVISLVSYKPLYQESKKEKNNFTRGYKKGQENTDKCRHVYQYDISSIAFRRKKSVVNRKSFLFLYSLLENDWLCAILGEE